MLEEDSFIHPYDGLFTFNERHRLYTTCITSPILAAGIDSIGYRNSSNQQMFNFLSDEMADTILKSPGFQFIIEKYELNKLNLKNGRINLSTPVERNNPHADDCKITVLYYANMDWHHSWCGQTLFFNKDCTNVEFTSMYVPGRLIVFSSHIPHMIVTPASFSELYRYSLAFQFF